MVKCSNKNPVYPLILPLILFLFMIVPAVADETPPGGSGVGILTLGGHAATSVELIPPANIDNWVLIPAGTGVNTIEGKLQVSADGDWQVSASDSSPTTNGHMTESDVNGYITPDPEQLDSVMSIAVASGGNVDTGYERALPAGGVIAIGPTTGNVLKDVKVNFKQPVLWTDKVLTGGHSYKIVVTFTISGYP
jgi:hypothetical protein